MYLILTVKNQSPHGYPRSWTSTALWGPNAMITSNRRQERMSWDSVSIHRASIISANLLPRSITLVRSTDCCCHLSHTSKLHIFPTVVPTPHPWKTEVATPFPLDVTPRQLSSSSEILLYHDLSLAMPRFRVPISKHSRLSSAFIGLRSLFAKRVKVCSLSTTYVETFLALEELKMWVCE